MTPQEVAAEIAEIRERVRARYSKTAPGLDGFELPSLDDLGKARDVAEGKVAAIGQVNPRSPGWINNAIQAVKKTVARSLNWLVREQIDFNRAVIASMDRNLEAMQQQNYSLLKIAREVAQFRRQAAMIDDLIGNWAAWKPQMERRLDKAEVDFGHAVRNLESQSRDREEKFRADWRSLHDDYSQALSKASEEIQAELWADLERVKAEQQRLIHTELRVIRRKTAAQASVAAQASPAPAAEPAVVGSNAAAAVDSSLFDYARFEERFRGDEAYVEQNQSFYLPYFEDCRRVLDLGCGRGELLHLLAQKGIEARGVDLDPEALEACREKGLKVVCEDLFAYLDKQPEGGADGIVCAHVVEHLPPLELPRLIEGAWRALRVGGVLALETPNPRCLAIFARDFYLDPTHQRPVPSALLDFHLSEAGFSQIEVVERHPAADVFPELRALDQIAGLAPFREQFFGGLDYAIIARKVGA